MDERAVRPPRSVRQCLVAGAIALVLVHGPFFVGLCWCLTGFGGWAPRWLGHYLLVVAAAPLLFVLFRTALLPTGPHRLSALLLLLVLHFAMPVPVSWIGRGVRAFALRQAGDRAMPLVHAIERFVQSEGRVPQSLDDLVPRWLPELPSRIPPFRIQPHSPGNVGWTLAADVSASNEVSSQLEFTTDPDRAWREANLVRRIGAWAIVQLPTRG
ncbi:MAG: hypothetical protein JNK15_00675 [Planctomycetes bacterium]|nr:hypothetical protein [Planctomycetota bacterium]